MHKKTAKADIKAPSLFQDKTITQNASEATTKAKGASSSTSTDPIKGSSTAKQTCVGITTPFNPSRTPSHSPMEMGTETRKRWRIKDEVERLSVAQLKTARRALNEAILSQDTVELALVYLFDRDKFDLSDLQDILVGM